LGGLLFVFIAGDGDLGELGRGVYRFRPAKQRFSDALEKGRLGRPSSKQVHRYRTASFKFFGGVPLDGSGLNPAIKGGLKSTALV
jgi:hypothetical protein